MSIHITNKNLSEGNQPDINPQGRGGRSSDNNHSYENVRKVSEASNHLLQRIYGNERRKKTPHYNTGGVKLIFTDVLRHQHAHLL